MTGKSLIRWARNRYRAVVIGAMVPLALLLGQPASGCVCADGRYDPLCRPGRCAANQKGGSGESTSPCCGCTCCARVGSQDSSHACCQGGKGCCKKASQGAQAARSRTPDAGVPHVDGKNGCTPVVRASVTPTLVASVKAVDDHQAPALVPTIVAGASPYLVSQPVADFEPDIGSPPDDLVVTLCRFTI